MAKKYINTELIKAEIERRKEEYKEDRYMSDYRGQIAYYKDKIYDGLLSFIDSLQQEQPSKELEAEIDRLWESFADEMEGPHNLYDIYARLAHHFAEWQKEQMLKDAVEANGVICKLSDRVWISPVDEEKFHQEVYDRFVVGQTVKIVIVPDKEG